MIAVLLVLAAAGQVPPSYGVAGSRREAEQAMERFAECEVRSAKGHVAALAFTREVEGTPSTYPQRLIHSSCAESGTSLRFKPALFRLALFPALYRRDYGKVAVADIAARPPVDYAREFDGSPSEQTLTIRRLGDCVVRGDPVNSRSLVISKLYSADEAAALVALQPALGQCVAAGQQLHFSRSIVHGAVGEALYKLTAAPSATKAN